MLRVLHARNPDWESLYHRVDHWLIEADGDQIVREVGLTADGVPIIAAPIGRNLGTWTLLPFPFDERYGVPIESNQFHQCWAEALAKLTWLDGSKRGPDEPA